MSAVLIEQVSNTVVLPRLCHILDFEASGSLCGAKPLRGNEKDIHDIPTCKREHQLCVVCAAMFNERYGRDW